MSQIFQSETTAIARCKYGPMMYFKNDEHIGRSLELYGEWYDLEIELLKQFIAPGDTVLDVGANIGTHTIPFAKMVGPSGCVIAFEAQRLIHGVLTTNILLNDLQNVRPLLCAAGHAHGSVKIPLLDIRVPNNFGAVGVHQYDFGEDVPMIKIDDLNLERCKLIKIDVEGVEASVMNGAAATIQKCRPFLFVENNTAEHAPEINTTLLSLGYQCWWFLAPNFRADNFNGFAVDIAPGFLEGNLFCAPLEASINLHGLESLAGPDDTRHAALKRLVAKSAK